MRILDQVRDDYADKRRNPRLSVKRLQLGMSLLDLPGNPPVRVTSIGASGGRALLYERSLSQCFQNGDTFLADRVPSVNHNIISGGLLIEFGQARIILGGDIDEEAWRETIRELPMAMLCANLVKVSHHGSETGYCEGLWDQISPKRTAIAVITPYSSQGLPSPEGLAHVSAKASSTACASVKAASLASDWSNSAFDMDFQDVSADILITLREIFPKTPDPTDRLEGMCSYFVASDGRVTEAFTGEAGKLG